jgi:hypothetical protein
MRTSLSKVAMVAGVVLLAAGCGGGGGGGEGGSAGNGTGGNGSGGHFGSGGTGGNATGGTGGSTGGSGGHGGGGAGAGGAAGGGAGGGGGGGGAVAGASGNGGAVAGASGNGGAAGHGGSAGGGGAAGSSGNGGAGGGAGGSAAGASGNGGAAGSGGSAAGASGNSGAAGAAGTSGAAGAAGTSGAAGAAGTSGAAGAAGTSGAAGAAGTSGAAGAAGTSGAAGAAGSAGGAGGAGGAAGSGTTAIQRIQDGTLATGAVVSVANVFVTALDVASNNDVTLIVQEPEGVTTSGHTYPEYAGVRVFITAAQAPGLGALGSISPGDCISLTGTTSEFQSATEIVTLTALSKAAATSACGTFPTPLAVPSTEAMFTDVATDTSGTAGDQPGTKAELFESVLVSFSNVTVSSAGTTTFRVKPQGVTTTPTLLVDQFFYPFAVPAVTTTYTQLTGIYTQTGTNPNFRLEPRGVLDLQ